MRVDRGGGGELIRPVGEGLAGGVPAWIGKGGCYFDLAQRKPVWLVGERDSEKCRAAGR